MDPTSTYIYIYIYIYIYLFIYIYIFIYIYVYGSNTLRVLVIALLMNREWRHQFWPDITIEKGCWNVIAVPLWEETLRNMFSWINGTFNYAMECVEGIKLFSRVQKY